MSAPPVQAIETRTCGLSDCERPLCARGLCRLHYDRQQRTGTTDAPKPRLRASASGWRGDRVTYGAVHLRMSSRPRPDSCEYCGTTQGRFEWALRQGVPMLALRYSPEGYAYSLNPAHYANACKRCHNQLDLGKTICHKGHPLAGENLYIQPANGKRFCRACQTARRAARTRREVASARFEFGEEG